MDEGFILAVDIGGTKLAAALVDARLGIHVKTVRPSVTSSSHACLSDIFSRLDELAAQADGNIDAIGVGTASMVDFAQGRIVESTNLPLRNVLLRDVLQERYGLPAVIDNDATVACIAEHSFGAGAGASEMLMLTVGTGIGGGIIANGRPYRGFSGAGGELGHIVIDVNGPRCQGKCPNYGCLESLVSGNALAAQARRLATRPGTAFARAAAAGERLDGPLVTRLAQDGDAEALAVYERLGKLLGAGMSGLVNVFNPELIVVGGAVAAAAGDLLLEPARRVVAERALIPQRDEVRIVPARFAADAGLVGAAALALTELSGAV